MTSKTLSLTDVTYLAAAIVAIGGGALGLYRGAVKIYRRTAGSRRDLARRLNQLGAGVTVRWVEERFGTSAFVRALTAVEAGDGAGAGTRLRELVYREKHAWLQVLADEHDAVMRFSVTVIDPRFHFRIRNLTNDLLDVRIGRSRFADIRVNVALGGRNLRIGAHNFEYAEAYWLSNPGNYQWFVVSHNDAGTGGFDFSIERAGRGWAQEGVLEFGERPPVEPPPFVPDAPYAQHFRAGTVINTLTILGPLQGPRALAEPRGPDSNQVRVLNPTARRRWQMRRRMRRVIRRAEREARRQQALEGKRAPA